MSKWPADDQDELIRFYGNPGTGEVAHHLVKVVPPFKFYMDKKPFPYFMVHEKCADAFKSALQKVWDYYGHDQALVDKLHISRTSGTYAPRRVRGSKTKWSNHAYGAAVDINAEDDPLGDTKFDQPLPLVAAFKSEGARWGGDYKHRKDAMHYEFCSDGSPSRTFEEWLKFYKCAPLGTYPLSKLPPEPKANAETPHEDESVRIRIIQQELDDLGYHNVGLIDGRWGGATAGAIAAFKNDRKLDGKPVIDDALVSELDRAIKEGWTRPIAKTRAEATEAEVAQQVPELQQARQGRLASMWAAITSFFSAGAYGVAQNFTGAVDAVSKPREILSDVPGWVWLLLAGTVAGFIWYKSRNTAAGITQSFKTGERS